MTKFRTNNPIGSTEVLDLYDNAENFDYWANDRENRNYEDRFGVQRKTWHGMEEDFQDLLINSGYQDIGEYQAGLEITARNQVFIRDGFMYRIAGDVDLPYTTTGDWTAESDNFVAIADSTIRGDLAEKSPNAGAGLVGFSRDESGAADRTALEKMRDIITPDDFGVIGDGVTDDTSAMLALDAAATSPVNLRGKTVYTTLSPDGLTGDYFNGEIIVRDNGNDNVKRTRGDVFDYELKSINTKTPVIDWSGRNVLWLGTSIPFYGIVNNDSYPDKVAKKLGFSVTNNAWASSHAGYDVNGNAFSGTTVRSLSMTEDDRLAGLSEYGPTSAYDDSFDPITKASSMTADNRILKAFSEKNISVVVLDHNHNDRFRELGVIGGESSTSITSITKGATTTITLSEQIFSVGDAVSLNVAGINKLNNHGARVMSVSGNDITISLDTSAYDGAFASGNAIKFDRTTIAGSFEFLIRYIRWAKALFWSGSVEVILSGAPSEYTYGTFDNGIRGVSTYIKEVAKAYNLPFYDVTNDIGITGDQNQVFLGDNVHPTTTNQRDVLASYWVDWLSGGKFNIPSHSEFLPAGSDDGEYIAYREAIYDPLTKTFGTPDFIPSDRTALMANNFSPANYATFSKTSASGGSSDITNETLPDGVTDSAKVFYDGNSSGFYLEKSMSPQDNPEFSFRFFLPTVTGATSTVGPYIVTVFSAYTDGGVLSYALQLVIDQSGITPRPVYFEDGNQVTLPASGKLSSESIQQVRFLIIKSTPTTTGRIVVYINNVETSNHVISNVNTGSVESIRLGVLFSNLPDELTYYLESLNIFYRNVIDFSTRFTGTYETGDSRTVTVVNGIITDVS